MKYTLFLLLFFIFILGVGYGNHNIVGYVYFHLLLQWPNSYCNTGEVICYDKLLPNEFTIHGLWLKQKKHNVPCPESSNEACGSRKPGLKSQFVFMYENGGIVHSRRSKDKGARKEMAESEQSPTNSYLQLPEMDFSFYMHMQQWRIQFSSSINSLSFSLSLSVFSPSNFFDLTLRWVFSF